jgi:hypothetical protein
LAYSSPSLLIQWFRNNEDRSSISDEFEPFRWVQGGEINRVFRVRIKNSANLKVAIQARKPSFDITTVDILKSWEVGGFWLCCTLVPSSDPVANDGGADADSFDAMDADSGEVATSSNLSGPSIDTDVAHLSSGPATIFPCTIFKGWTNGLFKGIACLVYYILASSVPSQS